jgi:hypothetical protein
LKLVHIPTHLVAQIWEKVCPFISNALEYAEDDYNVDQVKVYLSTGQWVLIAVANEKEEVVGALTVSFSNRPNDRLAFITTIGGRLISNKDTYVQLSNILKSFGATKVQGAARESVSRLWRKLGFKERYTIVENKL